MKHALLACLLLSCAAHAQNAAPTPAPPPPLVACEAGKDVPCVLLATKTSDIAGVWKQYQHNPVFAPAGNMGFIRYNLDGTFALGETIEGTRTVKAPYPSGNYRFENGKLVMDVKGAPPAMPECAKAVYRIWVIRVGSRPVALQYQPLEDTCKPRLADLAYYLIHVASAP